MPAKNSRDGKSRADRYREDNKELLRERLQGNGYIDQTLENIGKLENLDIELDSTTVTRIKAACDIRLKLLDKLVPNMKAIEVSGSDGGPLVITWEK